MILLVAVLIVILMAIVSAIYSVNRNARKMRDVLSEDGMEMR